jgi:hypothetical protein
MSINVHQVSGIAEFRVNQRLTVTNSISGLQTARRRSTRAFQLLQQKAPLIIDRFSRTTFRVGLFSICRSAFIVCKCTPTNFLIIRVEEIREILSNVGMNASLASSTSSKLTRRVCSCYRRLSYSVCSLANNCLLHTVLTNTSRC